MALSRHHAAAARPLSVHEIVEEAQQFEFGTARPLKAWLRSAQMLLTEAAMCEQDGNLQLSYLYLCRHAELVLGKLPKHPDYRNPQLKAELIQAQKAVKANLAKLEGWKPRIDQQHQRYMLSVERRKQELQRVEQERLQDQVDRGLSFGDHPDSTDGQFDGHGEALNANDYRQLAVDIAQRELERRGANRQSTRQSVETRNRQPQAQSRDDQATRETTKTHSYQYPSVPRKEAPIDWRPALSEVKRPPPSVPAKQAISAHSRERAPPVPPPSLPAKRAPSPVSADPLQSSKYTFKPAAFTESGEPLRTVMLPPDLRTTFLNIAHPNTNQNRETCGILCGTLISNALFISHLIIPDQHSTSDTCDTTEAGDNALFDYCDVSNLLVCGWIHTHPTQSCFLSSRDLHTSSGYQVMLPEAIAIVCAPRHNPDWGIFRLTDPPGLGALLRCEQKGLFHPHAEQHLYTDALRPGHVVEGPGLKFEVVDLRKP